MGGPRDQLEIECTQFPLFQLFICLLHGKNNSVKQKVTIAALGGKVKELCINTCMIIVMITMIIMLTKSIILYNNLRELFYGRNPGDARVKVESDREFASSPVAPNSGVAEIGCYSW